MTDDAIEMGRPVDLFILAGQSNAQGHTGDAAQYPADPAADARIPFWWHIPNGPSSGGWTTLGPQTGLYPAGHFGPEVSFARALRNAGLQPAVFKCALGSTSIANNWKAPGAGGMYDLMTGEYRAAVRQLTGRGVRVRHRAFVWIQGESDGETVSMAKAYEAGLRMLLEDVRTAMTGEPRLPFILGVDEQHPWMVAQPEVIAAQQRLARELLPAVFTGMYGLEKADVTHLTPVGLVAHGQRLADAFLTAWPDGPVCASMA